jgi:hypothetical protein
LTTKGRVRGAFTIDDIFPYHDAPTVFGQAKPDSCVAACCKMLLNDESLPESDIRVAVKVVRGEGADIRDIPEALIRLGASVSYRYEAKLSLDEFRAATEQGATVVSIKTLVTGHGIHAVMVDGFSGQMVLIRDPLPEWLGSAYKITTKTFTLAWTGEAVILDQ